MGGVGVERCDSIDEAKEVANKFVDVSEGTHFPHVV